MPTRRRVVVFNARAFNENRKKKKEETVSEIERKTKNAPIGSARPPSKGEERRRRRRKKEESKLVSILITSVPSKVSEKYTLAETERVALAKNSATATSDTRARRRTPPEREKEEEVVVIYFYMLKIERLCVWTLFFC